MVAWLATTSMAVPMRLADFNGMTVRHQEECKQNSRR